jgi:hypothetical protein
MTRSKTYGKKDKDDKGATYKPVVRCTGSHNRTNNASSLSCLFTTNLRQEGGLPEILAVDVQPSAQKYVEQCLEYVAYCMINSKRIVPDKYRFTLRLETRGHDYAYFACLQVTCPDQLNVLYQDYMNEALGETSMAIVLMPVFLPIDSDGLSWGLLPKAPESKTRSRDNIKSMLEDQIASPCGFIRRVDGDLRHADSIKLVRVSLADALSHVNGDDSWEIDWESAGLKKYEVQYIKKNSQHFLAMCMDGTMLGEKAKKYLAAVCDNGSRWQALYQDGKLVGQEGN